MSRLDLLFFFQKNIKFFKKTIDSGKKVCYTGIVIEQEMENSTNQKGTEMIKVYKEWLADENNNIVYKTLVEWAEYFGLKMVDGTTWCWKTREGRFIDVEVEGGYGLLHKDFGKYAYKTFFVGNADLDRMKIRIKR